MHVDPDNVKAFVEEYILPALEKESTPVKG
jgi:hypothetical protein